MYRPQFFLPTRAEIDIEMLLSPTHKITLLHVGGRKVSGNETQPVLPRHAPMPHPKSKILGVQNTKIECLEPHQNFPN